MSNLPLSVFDTNILMDVMTIFDFMGGVRRRF